MSVLLNGTTQYLFHSIAPIPELLPAGHTMSCWATRAGGSTMIAVCNGLGETADANLDQIQLRTTSSAKAESEMRTISGLSVSLSGGTWNNVGFQQAIAIRRADGDLVAYLDNIVGTPITPTIAPTGMTQVVIGARNGTNGGNFWIGYISEVGIWNRELTAQEIQDLSVNKYAPSMIPNGLLAYWSLLADFNDSVGVFHMTEVGGVAIDPYHPPGMVYPSTPTGIVTSRGFANMDRNFINMRG